MSTHSNTDKRITSNKEFQGKNATLRQSVKKNTYFIFMVLILLISIINVQAQSPSKVWDKTYGGLSTETGGITITALGGGYIIAGTSNSPITGEKSQASKGGNDFWIVKVDNNGTKLWDKVYGGAQEELLSTIIATSDGGYLLGGRSSSSIGGDVSQASKGSEDFWIVKIDGNGVKQWDKRFGGSSADLLSDIVKTSDGGFLIIGSSSSNISGDKSEANKGGFDYWMVKVDASFNKQWDKTYGGNKDDYLNSLVEAHGGGYLLGGSSDSDVSGDKTEATDWNTYTGSEVWLVKVNNSLTKEWDHIYTGHKSSGLVKLFKTTSGEYIIAGTYYWLVGAGYEHNLDNYWLFKISSTGTSLSSGLFGGSLTDRLASVTQTADGGFILGGSSSSVMSGEKSEPKIGGDENYAFDYWVIKTDSDFNKIWDKSIGGTNEDILQSLVVTPEGGYLLGGFSDSPLDYDKTQISRGGSDLWLVKLAPEGEVKVTDFTFNKIEENIQINAIVANSAQALKVEFYVNGIKLGEDNSAPFQFNWLNPLPGTHYVYLKVHTNSGQSSASFTKPFTNHLYNVELYKAININGPSWTVDSITFTGTSSTLDFTSQAKFYSAQHIALDPAPKSPLDQVIRSSGYSTSGAPATFTLTNVPTGPYEVYLYVWEDNTPSTYSIRINGDLALSNYSSGTKGKWAKIGPFKTNVQNQIVIKAEGGEANISAIEVYKIKGIERFYRAVNLNGPALRIDNLNFEASASAAGFSFEGKTFANQTIPLIPSTDGNCSQMLRSSVYSTSTSTASFFFENVPVDPVYLDSTSTYDEAYYSAYIYIWEDNSPSTFYIRPFNQSGNQYYYTSGSKGQWKVLGPINLYTARGFDLGFEVGGGDGNISGIELWKHYPTTNPTSTTNARTITSIPQTIVYPNSISDILKIKFPEAQKGKVTVKIVDMLGRTYVSKQKDLKGENVLSLDVPTKDMERGIYILQLQHANGKNETIRLNKD